MFCGNIHSWRMNGSKAKRPKYVHLDSESESEFPFYLLRLQIRHKWVFGRLGRRISTILIYIYSFSTLIYKASWHICFVFTVSWIYWCTVVLNGGSCGGSPNLDPKFGFQTQFYPTHPFCICICTWISYTPQYISHRSVPPLTFGHPVCRYCSVAAVYHSRSSKIFRL